MEERNLEDVLSYIRGNRLMYKDVSMNLERLVSISTRLFVMFFELMMIIEWNSLLEKCSKTDAICPVIMALLLQRRR